MQIILEHDEIVSAIETFVRGQISIAPNQDIEIDMKAGRVGNGFSATLTIQPKKSGKNPELIHRGTAVAMDEPAEVLQEKETAPEVVVTDDYVVEVLKSPSRSKGKACATDDKNPGIFAISTQVEEAPEVEAVAETAEVEAEPVEAPKKTSIFQFSGKTAAE